MEKQGTQAHASAADIGSLTYLTKITIMKFTIGIACLSSLLITMLANPQVTVAQAVSEEPTHAPVSEPPARAPEAPDNGKQWWDRLDVGGLLGPGLTTWVGEDADREFAHSINTFGFTFGGFANIELNRWLSIHPEILLAFKGSRTELRSGALNDIRDLRYIEVPLLAHITFPASKRLAPYLSIGPTAGYLLSFEVEDVDDGAISDRKDDARAIDMGLVIGLGANVALSRQHALVIEARYDRGLRGIDKTDMADIQNQILSIMLGYQYSFASAPASGSPDHPAPEEMPAPPAADGAAPAGQLP